MALDSQKTRGDCVVMTLRTYLRANLRLLPLNLALLTFGLMAHASPLSIALSYTR